MQNKKMKDLGCHEKEFWIENPDFEENKSFICLESPHNITNFDIFQYLDKDCGTCKSIEISSYDLNILSQIFKDEDDFIKIMINHDGFGGETIQCQLHKFDEIKYNEIQKKQQKLDLERIEYDNLNLKLKEARAKDKKEKTNLKQKGERYELYLQLKKEFEQK